MTDAQNRKLSAYSTGMRQRLSLARALMHSPEILFLDEPTSGLDPESAQNVNTLIQELAACGTTIFLCTHQLRYAQEICTTYGLMDKGSLFATGDIEKLRAMVSDKVKVRVKASCLPKDMEYEKIGEHTYDISVNSEDEIPLIVKRIVGVGGDIYQVLTEKMSLEEIYFSLIDRNHGEMERGNL
ncbi:MAG: ABC transporter ATP-binding protein [Lachnospiraceae bacterium]|nr:ABC transporter ATP-binding protein [Lachnospiraceae bacterium]